MSNPLAINIAIANVPPEVDIEAIYRFIESNGGDFETYELAPSAPGVIRNAAIDYVIWLPAAVSSATAIADLLWRAYDKFIAPKKKNQQNEGAALYVAMRKPDGTIVDYSIGSLQNVKDVFSGDFALTVTAMQKAPGASKASEQVEAELKFSGLWIRRK